MQDQKDSIRASSENLVPDTNHKWDKVEQKKTRPLQQPRPTNNDRYAWRSYWRAQKQLWRTEPEISFERQELLKERCITPVDAENGNYPFAGMKLDRADIEFLAIYESGKGAIDCNDEQQRREGLDLRGADLKGAHLSGTWLKDANLSEAVLEGANFSEAVLQGADLSAAALEGANLSRAWLGGADFSEAALEGANLSRAWLEGANLYRARLEGANLSKAWLDDADLSEAVLKNADLSAAWLKNAALREVQLEGANLYRAQLKRADLSGAQLKGAVLIAAQLEGADLSRAQLKGTVLIGAQLKGAVLIAAQLEGADLNGAQLKGADLSGAQLKGAVLIAAQLEGADLSGTQLKGADLSGAQLKSADLYKARLKGANLSEAMLEGVNLSEAVLESTTLNKVLFSGINNIGPFLADVQWGNTNLAVVNWSQVTVLGEEYKARYAKNKTQGNAKKGQLLERYQKAVRANRQLAVALQGQGLNEDAVRFAYRANVLQRKVLWCQTFLKRESEQENTARRGYDVLKKKLDATWKRISKFWSYLFSLFLDVLAGYGYQPGKALGWYFFFILGFALSYALFGHLAILPDALVYSLTSFHGRGFLPGLNGETITLHSPLVILAACEAVIGLLIELSFIATFTQRFLGK